MKLAFDVLSGKVELCSVSGNGDSICYLINAYTKNPEEGFLRAVQATKLLMKLGLSVFSPVVYGHTVVQLVGRDAFDGFWLPINRAVMEKADVVCVLKDDMLADSEGSRKEWEFFSKASPKKLLLYNWEEGTLIIQDWSPLSWEDILNS